MDTPTRPAIFPNMKIDEILAPHRRRHTGPHHHRHARRQALLDQAKLQALLDQAARQDGWTRELRAILPHPLGNACRVVAIRDETLVVLCADGAVATRLRFQTSELLDQLRVLKHYSQVTRLEIRVSRVGDRLTG